MRELEEEKLENGSNGSFLLDQEGLTILKCLTILPDDNVLEMYSKSRLGWFTLFKIFLGNKAGVYWSWGLI